MEKSLSHLKEEAVELKEIYGCEYTAYEKWLKKVKNLEEIIEKIQTIRFKQNI